MLQDVERRRIQRINSRASVSARVGAKRAMVLDISLTGVRIAHEESVGRVGETCAVDILWNGERISLRCEIKRTQIQRVGPDASSRTIYHSGLLIIEASQESSLMLRKYVEHQVRRALDEQKANAAGIPPLAPSGLSPRVPTDLVCHELTPTGWRVTATTEREQPSLGFTVSSEHTPREIEMLRSAYERGVRGGTRELIRRLAQLSITPTEAISVRKYVP